MKNRILLLLISTTLFWGCDSQISQPRSPNIIPKPVSVNVSKGQFRLERTTVIQADTSNPEIRNIVNQLKKELDSATGFDLEISSDTTQVTNVISLHLSDTSYLPKEGYTLSVSTNKITLTAAAAAGLFYGMQSLLQLFPPRIYQSDYTMVPQNVGWTVPIVEIEDYPRFKYRGLHLDVSRHFFPINFIKRYIDLMAMHKMNRFHWHLTDDQGWRIEIKQYPKLTEAGAWRDSTLVGHYGTNTYDGDRYGGFYTQEEIREVVDYAQKRHVTIIPEIEMPGHASAALASYPELGCIEGKAYQVKPTWGIFEDIYCPSEQTFTFLENVLTEVMDLFPSKYIHIGGDEAPKAQWKKSQLAQQIIKSEGLENEEELQNYFITRIEKFLNAHGRKIIGWDEILEGGLAPNATVMSWRGTQGGIEAASHHHNVVMTPGNHLYFDYYQANAETEPLAIGWLNTLEEVYAYEPIPEELNKKEAQYILGAQGNIWTEYMHSGDKVQYMAYPRAAALAEVIWSPKRKRNWTNFWRRLQTHFKRLEILNVNAAEHYRGKIPTIPEGTNQ